MGYSTLGAPSTVGGLDMVRVAKFLNDPTITPLQRQARLSAFSAMCTMARSSWKRAAIILLEHDTCHKIKRKF